LNNIHVALFVVRGRESGNMTLFNTMTGKITIVDHSMRSNEGITPVAVKDLDRPSIVM
jgi:hypothetical protein